MARGGYILWAKSDRHMADYVLRNTRKALAKAIERNDSAEIAMIKVAEARAVAEVERVEALRVREVVA